MATDRQEECGSALHKCPFGEGKCQEVMALDKLKDHRLDCKFSELNICSAALDIACPAKLSRSDFVKHLRQVHRMDVLVPDQRSMFKDSTFLFIYNPSAQPKTSHKFRRVLAIPAKDPKKPPEAVFVLVGEFKERKRSKWTLYVVGSKTKARQYKCEVTFGLTACDSEIAWQSWATVRGLWDTESPPEDWSFDASPPFPLIPAPHLGKIIVTTEG